MKKLMIILWGVALTFTGAAQDVPKAEGDKPVAKAEEAAARPSAEARQQRQRMRREGMRNRQRPVTFAIDEKTTSEQIEAFKKEVCAKIDEAAKAYAAQEGEKKSPKNIILFVNDRPNRARYEGMREGGMRRGPRDGMRRGPREGGDRGPREGGDRPAASAEAKK
jgi:hypothetical protein